MTKEIQQVTAPFDDNQLQSWLVITENAIKKGFTLEEFHGALRSYQNEKIGSVTGRKLNRNETKHKHIDCPECGRGEMVPATTDGTFRARGCKRCRYSEVY